MMNQGFGPDDGNYQGSSVPQLRRALYENPYCDPWPGVGNFSWPDYPVTLASVLRGILPFGEEYAFLSAAKRTIDSKADLRWGNDGLGFRRLLHPNGICLLGRWIIDTDNAYSGYFKKGSVGQVVARYSTCCTYSRSDQYRSLSLVGKVFPTAERDDETKFVPAGFITQEDLGGSLSESIRDVELRNAPDTTFYRRGWGSPILLVTGLTFLIADREPAFRQMYEIAELNEKIETPTSAPRFVRFRIPELANPVHGKPIDFRDEIMAQIYDPNDRVAKRQLQMTIEVSDDGKSSGPLILQRRSIKNWKAIGRIEFDEAVASYNGDFVIHFHHPSWRTDRNNDSSAIRQQGLRTRW